MRRLVHPRQLIGIACLLACVAGGAIDLAAQTATTRPKVAVALGGGSARGLAHVGFLRWLEEHRIPIDIITGTSMGGLVGGSYATGMTPDEIETMLNGIDWDAMFGASRFQFVNVRRKRDLRAYPSRLEFGLSKGIVPPPSLNNGQQVDLLLARIAATSYAASTFNDLPTPFACVAVDLKSARPVVLRAGSLSRALRATMSLPLIFPPVVNGDQVLVDGGAMDNIPADVARTMGADRVIAVNVGDLDAKTTVDSSLLGLAMETLDAMMRANTLRATAEVDVMINVPLEGFGSLDWRRAADLIKQGYLAGETMKARLLPLAISEVEWQQWHDARMRARQASLPVPAFVEVIGAGASDAAGMRMLLQQHVGVPLDLTTLEESIRELGGLDRYETLSWALVSNGTEQGLQITARPKTYGPPFVFLGISLENTTGNEFRFGLGGRYLAFDVLGSGSELRLDAGIGSDPSLAAALYRPLWWPRVFIEPIVGVGSTSLSAIQDGRTVAEYRRSRVGVLLDIGLNLGRIDELRTGVSYGWSSASVRIGDPGLPEADGEDSAVHLKWIHDGQDDAVVPSTGTHAQTELRRYLAAPYAVAGETSTRTSEGVSQLQADATWVKSLTLSKRRRVFAVGGFGTSFNGDPLQTEQFALGGPLHMSAFSVGEKRGDHYVTGGLGYLHQVLRLPDFLGGPVFLGGWVETGSAFNDTDSAEIDFHGSTGLIADTLIGPVFLGASVGSSGDSRYYIGIGKIFR